MAISHRSLLGTTRGVQLRQAYILIISTFPTFNRAINKLKTVEPLLLLVLVLI